MNTSFICLFEANGLNELILLAIPFCFLFPFVIGAIRLSSLCSSFDFDFLDLSFFSLLDDFSFLSFSSFSDFDFFDFFLAISSDLFDSSIFGFSACGSEVDNQKSKSSCPPLLLLLPFFYK